MPRRCTTTEFVEKARKVHGKKYKYDRVEYLGSSTKIEIYCRKCEGYFWQLPSNHLYGQNCGNCAKNNHKTTDQFIIEAQKLHGDKYNNVKIKIYCRKCEDYFEQLPTSHLRGSGCNKACANNNQKTIDQFLEDAKRVHGDKYGYDKVKYRGNKKKVKIYCRKCEEYFKQKPNSHISSKQGCMKCSGSARKTVEEFIDESRKIHGNKYNYSKVRYKNNKTLVTITCLKCEKDFEQVPNSHLFGHGCPNCIISRGEEEIRVILDEMKIDYKPQFKFENSRRRYDIYFEYRGRPRIYEMDGQQHFEDAEHWNYNAEEQHKIDIEKTMRVLDEGMIIVRIDYKIIRNPKRLRATFLKSLDLEEDDNIFLSTPSMYRWLIKGLRDSDKLESLTFHR